MRPWRSRRIPTSGCRPSRRLARFVASLGTRSAGRAGRGSTCTRTRASPGFRVVSSFALTLAGALAFSVDLRAESGPPRLTQVERFASDEAARIVLHFSQPVAFHKGVSRRGDGKHGALVVDLPEAVYSGPPTYEMGGLVDRVRLVPIRGGVRVEIEATPGAVHQAFFFPEPFRVVVDVATRRLPADSGGRRVDRIALDPGHGGVEPGAVGQTGLQEKDVALDIAHRAAPLLARELGVITLLTRDVDQRVSLEERVAKANAFAADLFVSIHCNAEPSRSARGVMTFVLDGSHDHRAHEAAERENAAPSTDPLQLAEFLRQFDDTAAATGSRRFARLLQRATLASLSEGYADTVDGGVRGAGFYVLAGARMPAVLFETSFVSNEVEEQRLGSSRYRQKLADSIVNAVRAYRAGY
jgi:N-acetylmuramoyl-L-alanine amidase